MEPTMKTRWTNPMTEQERRNMVRSYIGGATSREVAAKFGVHPAYVRKAAARAGFTKSRYLKAAE